LRGARQQLHSQIAAALETQFPGLVDNQPELLAQHYAEAGLIDKSVAFWGQAGRRSVARSAMAEAAAQFQKALDQLARLPDTTERQRQELELLTALGVVLHAVKGLASPETGHAYIRARELWEQLGFPSEFLAVPYGQSRYHAFRGEFELALHLDEDLLRLSRRRNDSAGLVLGHLSSGRNLFYVGRFASSRSHLEEALAAYDPIPHGSLVHQIGLHPRVSSQGFLAFVLFCIGYPDQALAQCDLAIAEARRLAHQPTLAASLALDVGVLSLVGDEAALDERASELIALATEQGFPLWRLHGTLHHGWVQVKNGEVTEGISLLRHGLSAFRATGGSAMASTGLLARACEIVGQIEEAMTVLDEALQTVEKTGERWFAAELNRQKGQLLLRQGDAEAADELYRKALDIAREQEAKLWELRAVVSLARLRRDEGRRAEARDLLAPVYGWFTEGFDTADLKEAKGLLDGLR
jgi:predicted ATPase